jgi:apolipoprotein N-acyltransferase
MADLPALFAARSTWFRFVSLATLGILAGLGQAPTDLWFMTVLAFAAVFVVLPLAISPRQAAFHIWAFGFGYFAFSLRWIIEPFLVDIARHGWMAPFAIFLMATGAALFWAIAGWLSARFAPRNVVILAFSLVGAEVTRSLILTGFPWALIGHIWVPTHLAQLAAFGGPHLLSLVTVFAGLCIASFLGKNRIVALVGLGGLIALAFVLRPVPTPTSGADAPIVRLVQPNARQDQKWDAAYRDVFLNRMIRLTSEGSVPDLVVWPETAVPFLLDQIEDDLRIFSDAARGAPLVFGIQRRDDQRQYYNSLVVMGSGGVVQSVYDKRHLVPFGEYIPGGRLLGRLGVSGLAANLVGGFTPGATKGTVYLPGIGRAVALICYEGIFAEEINYDGDRPRLLLLITNDAWFGEAVGPLQHLAQARLRAIEQGLPMVRVANTGISAMIDAKGRVIASMPMGIDGAIDATLPRALPATLYSRAGDWPLLVVLVLLTLLVYRLHRRDTD